MKGALLSSSRNRLLGLAFGVLAAGCATVPTMTTRDAAVLEPGLKRTDMSGGMPVIFRAKGFGDRPADGNNRAYLGGPQGDVAFRRGLGGGREQAIRLGAGLVGAYGGYERAKALAKPGPWGAVAFGGGAGGIHLAANDGWPFLQPYAGLIAGRTRGTFRPEVAVRIASQTGLVSRDSAHFYLYAVGFAVAEPRLRIQTSTYALFGGFQIGVGVGRCQECFASLLVDRLTILTPTAGLSFAPEAD